MRKCTCLAITVFLLTMGVTALAGADIPDLKGTWVIKGEGHGHEKSSESAPKIHAKKFGVHNVVITLTIDKQEGVRFSGYKASDRQKETVSGVIGFDNKTLYMVDDDGMNIARLVSPDKIETVYFQLTKHHSIVGRAILTRKR